jgi:hypothetical protein
MSPGKELMFTNTCAGRVHAADLVGPLKPKLMVHVQLIAFLTVVIHVAFGAGKMLFKVCNKNRFVEYQQYEHRLIRNVSKDNIHVFAVHFVGVVTVPFFWFYLPYKFNNMHPVQFNTYPNYLYLYANELVLSPVVTSLFVFLFLSGSDTLKRRVFKDVKNIVINRNVIVN